MSKYQLSFITDQAIFEHVKETTLKYRFSINLKQFNQNLIDPIKLTFDSKIYKKSVEAVLESEIIRQLDKSNTNHIGYFHQNIFKHIGYGEWIIPQTGYDIINEKLGIYVEMKNKHNTMNSSSSQKTYMRMQNTLLSKPNATCMLVEVIAARSQNIPWINSLDGQRMNHPQIRRVSIDKFYEIVTGEHNAFKNLCSILPKVIDDVIETIPTNATSNTVLSELELLDKNILKTIYLLSFSHYEGFHDFTL